MMTVKILLCQSVDCRSVSLSKWYFDVCMGFSLAKTCRGKIKNELEVHS